MERRIYPYIITLTEGTYYVNFVDLDNCFTDGETLEEAMVNAKDVLEGMLFVLAKNNQPMPTASVELKDVKENERLAYADVWLDPIRQKAQNQAVKKTLTIPKWLNDEAEKQGVNFSNILQAALKEELGIRG